MNFGLWLTSGNFGHTIISYYFKERYSMSIQRVNESVIYNRAKRPLKVGDVNFRTQVQTWDPPEYAPVLEHWFKVRDRLTFLRQNLARANNRDNAKSINVNLDQLWEIGEKQDWKCAYTGTPLEFSRGGDFGNNTNPNSCTIDRINSSIGYWESNVQLITWQVNCAKNAMTHEQFLELCKLVTKRFDI